MCCIYHTTTSQVQKCKTYSSFVDMITDFQQIITTKHKPVLLIFVLLLATFQYYYSFYSCCSVLLFVVADYSNQTEADLCQQQQDARILLLHYQETWGQAWNTLPYNYMLGSHSDNSLLIDEIYIYRHQTCQVFLTNMVSDVFDQGENALYHRSQYNKIRSQSI